MKINAELKVLNEETVPCDVIIFDIIRLLLLMYWKSRISLLKLIEVQQFYMGLHLMISIWINLLIVFTDYLIIIIFANPMSELN